MPSMKAFSLPPLLLCPQTFSFQTVGGGDSPLSHIFSPAKEKKGGVGRADIITLVLFSKPSFDS